MTLAAERSQDRSERNIEQAEPALKNAAATCMISGGGCVPGEIINSGKDRRWFPRWFWSLGFAVAGVGAAAAFLLRGCWHAHVSWPIRYDADYSYRVCTDCGAVRLFDEKTFREYGPYHYDLDELIAREKAARSGRVARLKQAAVPAVKVSSAK